MMQKSLRKVSNWKYWGRRRIISLHVPLILKNILVYLSNINIFSNVDIALISVGQTVAYTLTTDDEGHFGVDNGGNLYKASNKTNFETSKSHKITVKITDNGSPSMSVSFNWADSLFGCICVI